jgi:hypothetical protein
MALLVKSVPVVNVAIRFYFRPTGEYHAPTHGAKKITDNKFE